MQEFQQILGMKCDYNGHVWDTSGKIFRVSTVSDSALSSSPDYPYERHRGYCKNDKFHTSTRKTTITLEEIEGDDLVFDENGNYVCVKPDANSVKGEIFIRKQIHKGPMAVFEDIPLEGARSNLSLTPEAYSKIFTYILNLDKGIKKNMSRIRKGEVSVQVQVKPGVAHRNDFRSNVQDYYQYYNMTEKEVYIQHNAYAYAEQRKDAGIIVAIIDPRSANEMYATLWNVISLLGVHEMGHLLHPWWKTINRTHHLNYVYQMGHNSWKNTSVFFQGTEKRNFEGYINSSDKYFDENPEKTNREVYRNLDFYPKKGESLYDYVDRTKKPIQNFEFVKARSPFKSTYGGK